MSWRFPRLAGAGVTRVLTELQRIAELERKVGQLTLENDFLKKAWQHFRDHHPPAEFEQKAGGGP